MELRGCRATVLGMGKSGMGAVEALLRRGAVPFVSDSRPASRLSQPIVSLQNRGIAFETGGHGPRALSADLLVTSPGVPDGHPVLRDARRLGIPVWGELELAFRLRPQNWVAITGSNGKSTTTSLVGDILGAASRQPSRVVGNIGISASSALEGFPAEGIVVAEVSSFQLESIESFAPAIGAVLNLTPDHLDRYESTEEYYAAKRRMFLNMGGKAWAVLNRDDPNQRSWIRELREQCKTATFGEREPAGDGVWAGEGAIRSRVKGNEKELVRVDDFALPGRHNLENLMAALLICEILGVKNAEAREAVKGFRGLEHRMEFVARRNGVLYYNDSKATTLESVRCALESFSVPVRLIAGGRSKGSRFEKLSDTIGQRCAQVIVLGEAAAEMCEAWKGSVPVRIVDNMSAAVRLAAKEGKEGEAVLLSPGCASYDMYANFEERGCDFKSRVLEL